MEISKSSRHSKITGDFGEALVLYWLSKHGFECVHADHTGIDIIACNPSADERMGISVKSRSRSKGTSEDYVRIPKGNFPKAEKACKDFGCVPYFAIVVDGDEDDTIRGFILTKAHLLDIYPECSTGTGWKMTQRDLRIYRDDPQIMKFELRWGQYPAGL